MDHHHLYCNFLHSIGSDAQLTFWVSYCSSRKNTLNKPSDIPCFPHNQEFPACLSITNLFICSQSTHKKLPS